MASTNHTQNINLCQWVGTDPVLMADFNDDNAKIDAAITSLRGDLLRMSVVAYTGTGESGSEHCCSVTFPFVPQLLFISGRTCGSVHSPTSVDNTLGDADWHVLLPYDALMDEYESHGSSFNSNWRFLTMNGSGSSAYCPYKLSDNGKTLTWYSLSNAASQLNTADTIYYCVVIG